VTQPKGASACSAVACSERALYLIEAHAGRRMSLRMAAAEGNAAFQVHAPGGEPRRGSDPVLEVFTSKAACF
jgi:hypothetical protein